LQDSAAKPICPRGLAGADTGHRQKSLIIAIRTAKWPRIACDAASQPEWDAEIEQSVMMAHRILSHLLAKSPFLFPQEDMPWHQPGEDESPK
jgi:hypothetical protein